MPQRKLTEMKLLNILLMFKHCIFDNQLILHDKNKEKKCLV